MNDGAFKDLYDMMDKAKDLRLSPKEFEDELKHYAQKHMAEFWYEQRNNFYGLSHQLRNARRVRMITRNKARTVLYLSIKKAYPLVPRDIRKLICNLID